MSRYVITITRDNGGAEAPHTTVRVDTSTGQTRITELTVRAGNRTGLAPGDLPPLDLDLLVRALTASAPALQAPTVTRGSTARSAPARQQTGRRRGRVPAAASGKRAYRRMPEPAEVMAAYEQAGSITGAAEHFGVPRHTVASWARRLRDQGYAIGRQ
ncbi:hypothetical protein [Phytohabitans aurantiacus]|uniref:Helix-turn-helix domain-containing protein n=1 Tax=Phytohabitans aurantiacus TaxID=3016789 RepID=A0ABQ5R038_9ACTN|nr:hypothetical protein [Phytohabitans aurantiacus]GLI00179.1 hypothetical protein Pa4123_54550 [Phytohabitans aurantiacus]